MEPHLLEMILHWAGGIFALVVLGILLFGIWRGTRRFSTQPSARRPGFLRSALFYLIATICFLIPSIFFWRPLPLDFTESLWLACQFAGALIFFPGLTLLLWGRLTLGRMYFVSTSFTAQLYSDHHLVTSGPYAFMRHPMYTGLIAAAFGGLLLYLTWTSLAFAFLAPFVLLRARREEKVLSTQFGREWEQYSRRVGAFLPRLTTDVWLIKK